MANVFIVTAVSTRERNSKNVDIDNIIFVDTDNNKIAYGKYELLQKVDVDNFNKSTRRYKNDNVNIEDSVGTLAFVNTELKFYGILRQMGSKLVIEWITEKQLNEDKNYNKIANINNTPVDITPLGTKVFNKNWLSIAKQVFVSEVNYKIISKDMFMESINGISNNEDTQKDIKVEDNTIENIESSIEDKENTSNINKYNEEQKDNTIEIINNIIIKRLAEIELKEKALAKKEKDIEEKSNRLDRLLSKLENIERDKVVGAIVDVDNIYKFDYVKRDTFNKEDLANEFSLKMLNDGAITTIDKKYFNKLHYLNKKSLESNLGYTSYKMIVSLKFERESEYSIIGILDCNNDNDYVTFKVLKSYSNLGVTETEINKFYLEYLKNRKQNHML